MGFSGKPSKGCLPCRQKRTKCDLGVPSCTQCLRKNRMCFGYRNEQDMVFRNETGLVIRKVKRKASGDDDAGGGGGGGGPASVVADEDAFAMLDLSALVQHPSRRATLQDEAIMHWLRNFNERFFSSSHDLRAGYEYILPVYRSDLERGGPAVEIIQACGLAALGNSKGSPELLRAGRVKQIKVLKQLNEQLQDPELALSDSSVLTCLLLSSFENMVCDGARSMYASQTHLKGAATLVKLRGKSQFSTLVGHGMFVRLRGSIFALCLLQSDPLPDYLLQHLEEEKLGDEDFEVRFYKTMDRVCTLRSLQKQNGFVTASMVTEARAALASFAVWDTEFPSWVLPPGHPSPRKGTGHGADIITQGADESHRFIWVAMSWLLIQAARILVTEIVIVYLRAQVALEPDPSPSLRASLDESLASQRAIAQDVQDAVEYYLAAFATTAATTRSIGAHMLMMPLSVLLGASTTQGPTYAWIARTAAKLAEVFALRQGKMVADFLISGVKSETFALGPSKKPLSYTSSIISDVGDVKGGSGLSVETRNFNAGEGGERSGSGSGSGSGEGSFLPTPETSPQSRLGRKVLVS